MTIQTNHYDSNTIGNLNRRYANELGWKSKYHQIKFILNITKTLPDPMDFAQAVSNWQALHPPLKTDGLLGPNTWKRLKLLTQINAPSISPLPSWLRMNTKTQVKYNVPMKAQGPSPICWLACMAMMLSYRNRRPFEISSLTGGTSPANASLPTSAVPGESVQAFTDQVRIMRKMGFKIVTYRAGWFSEEDLLSALRTYGPLIAFLDAARIYNHPEPESGHAVVITGINTSTDTCYINNPWGQQDEPKNVDLVLNALDKWKEKSFAPEAALMSLR